MSHFVETERNSPWAVFVIFLRLGLTAFGGPVAHLGYFREEFVLRRHWLSEHEYADLVALCQFLPGPASSQVGIALGLSRAGYAGAWAAWAGFTLPSATLLILCALGVARHGDAIPPGLLHGLKVVAVAVVVQAVWGMSRSLCPDAPRIGIMVAAAGFTLLVPTVWGQMAVMAMAAVVGVLWLRAAVPVVAQKPVPHTRRRRAGLYCLILFCGLLLGLPLLSAMFASPWLNMVDAFYRVGSLVFGGGHVVMPLLQAELVPSGWVNPDVFLAGYGLVQAVPGPLFTFAAFLGASMNHEPAGWLGGIVCLLAIFAPSFLLVVGALPFWERLRSHARMRSALSGTNAAVVGLLLAALYRPVWTGAIHTPLDGGLVLLALVALMAWKLPPWLVVLGGGLVGWLIQAVW